MGVVVRSYVLRTCQFQVQWITCSLNSKLTSPKRHVTPNHNIRLCLSSLTQRRAWIMRALTRVGAGSSCLAPKIVSFFKFLGFQIDTNYLTTEIRTRRTETHLQVGFSVRHCSAPAIHDNPPMSGGFSLRCPFLHTPSTQSHPYWVRFVFSIEIVSFFKINLILILTTWLQDFVDDGQRATFRWFFCFVTALHENPPLLGGFSLQYLFLDMSKL